MTVQGTSLPRLLIAAPTSSTGKTTVSVGIMAAMCRRGLRVSGHKVGPDYIDPGYHSLASGRPPRTLDPVLQGEDLIAPLLLHGARGADLAVIEGVMGMFDGAALREGFGSSAHVASLTATPVVLVVDASRVGRSIAATILGFATFMPDVAIRGVILNRVASPRHEAEMRSGIAMTGIPVLGTLPRDEDASLPSRHLGLVGAAEYQHAEDVVGRIAELVDDRIDLDTLLAIARSAPPLAGEPWDPSTALGRPSFDSDTVVAICAGPAFSFRYTEQVELLHAAGARVIEIDPLRDEALPAGTGGLILPGGYPELHADALSANVGLRRDIARHAADGLPVLAECGGLLYLLRELSGVAMCGVIDATAQMSDRLVIGYRSARALRSGIAAVAGDIVSGHEFHRTRTAPESGIDAAWEWNDGTATVQEGFVNGGVHASYLHVHPASRPQTVLRLLDAA